MTNDERLPLWLRYSGFVINSSFVIRASSFRSVRQFADREGAPIFFARLRRVFLLRGRDSFLDFRGDLGAHPLQCVAIEQSLFDDEFLRALQGVLRERFAFDFVGDVTGVIVFAVAGESQSLGDDELRWTAGPGAFDGRFNDIETGAQIGGVNGGALVAITFRAIDQVGAGKGGIVLGGGRGMIVR